MALGCITRRRARAVRSSSCMNMLAIGAPGSRKCGYFSRSHRCVTYSQRGYPPSDIPEDGAKYSQDIFRDDVIAVMDALKIEKAHVVGHSMGAATALHVGIHYPERCLSVTAAGCGYGSSPDPKIVEEARAVSRETGKMFAAETMAVAAARYGDGPTRQAHKTQGPTRLCAIHPDAERAFLARPFAGHAQSAGQAADAVGDGSGLEEILPAVAGAGRRRGRMVRRRQYLICAASCRRRGFASFRARATPSPARSGRHSTRRSPISSPTPKPAVGWRINRSSKGRTRWTSSSKAKPRW